MYVVAQSSFLKYEVLYMDYREQVRQARVATDKRLSDNPIVGVGDLCVDLMVIMCCVTRG